MKMHLVCRSEGDDHKRGGSLRARQLGGLGEGEGEQQRKGEGSYGTIVCVHVLLGCEVSDGLTGKRRARKERI
jgi:hypothetical protein